MQERPENKRVSGISLFLVKKSTQQEIVPSELSICKIQIHVFVAGIEAGTCLGGIQVMVTHDACIGVELQERAQHLVEDDELFGSAIVLVLVLRRAAVAPLVTDAYRTRIPALDVAAAEADGTRVVERAVATDVEVITGVGAETPCPVVTPQLLEGVVLVGTRVGAMQDQEVNRSGRSSAVRTQQGQHLRPWRRCGGIRSRNCACSADDTRIR